MVNYLLHFHVVKILGGLRTEFELNEKLIENSVVNEALQ